MKDRLMNVVQNRSGLFLFCQYFPSVSKILKIFPHCDFNDLTTSWLCERRPYSFLPISIHYLNFNYTKRVKIKLICSLKLLKCIVNGVKYTHFWRTITFKRPMLGKRLKRFFDRKMCNFSFSLLAIMHSDSWFSVTRQSPKRRFWWAKFKVKIWPFSDILKSFWFSDPIKAKK